MSSDLRLRHGFGIAHGMKKPPDPQREARLAEALRNNLRRRKLQDSDQARRKERLSSPKPVD